MEQALVPASSLDLLMRLSQLYHRYYQIVRIYYVFNLCWCLASCTLFIVCMRGEYISWIALQVLWILYTLGRPSAKSNVDTSCRSVAVDIGGPLVMSILIIIRVYTIGIAGGGSMMGLILVVVDESCVIAWWIVGQKIGAVTGQMDKQQMYYVNVTMPMPCKELPPRSPAEDSSCQHLWLSLRDFHIEEVKSPLIRKLKDSNGFIVQHIQPST